MFVCIGILWRRIVWNLLWLFVFACGFICLCTLVVSFCGLLVPLVVCLGVLCLRLVALFGGCCYGGYWVGLFGVRLVCGCLLVVGW